MTTEDKLALEYGRMWLRAIGAEGKVASFEAAIAAAKAKEAATKPPPAPTEKPAVARRKKR